MFPKFLSLLGLGFCLGQRIWTFAGGHNKPSLSAWPSPVVPLGGSVTLQCHFYPPFTSFKLIKRNGTPSPELQRDHINTFTMSPMTTEHVGSYRCFGHHSHTSGWSAPSDALEIVVTEEAVTLHCHSELIFDQFILCKKGDARHSWQVVEKLHARNGQAHFSMGPMTPAHSGTYKCYGSVHHSPYEWSVPSDPLKVVITATTQ
ncbi:putative killer cell immunoglobulin-like receptor-like protein KIR3DX1 [Phyllostomus discolor]|uniref:Killer cell immunoglobulin-like receptor-like protein KIR3DX1 n=1 Tax=Phyllostomus discolor TaxID=89673 RepID=A0A7E6CR03_9CHIR|nr:putative killer cell immunoglobulin-like receptor-like protein KIR3DX1 [Phyllostomus discolor]